MGEEDMDEEVSISDWDDMVNLSSISIPSSVQYWRYRQLFHEKNPPFPAAPTASCPSTSVGHRMAYSPSRRWALYAFMLSTYNPSRSQRYQWSYRVVPISHSDDVALQHHLSFILRQQSNDQHTQLFSSRLQPPSTASAAGGGIFRLSLKECFDISRAMGDLLAVPNHSDLALSLSSFPTISTTTSCMPPLPLSLASPFLPPPPPPPSSSESKMRQDLNDVNFPIWRYSIRIESELSIAVEPSWHPLEPCTLVFSHAQGIKAQQSAPSPHITTTNDNSNSNSDGIPGQSHAGVVGGIQMYQYRLPQRDIDKSIWMTMIDKSTANGNGRRLPTSLIEIIFEYIDC
jgi:hypothetical protein